MPKNLYLINNYVRDILFSAKYNMLILSQLCVCQNIYKVLLYLGKRKETSKKNNVKIMLLGLGCYSLLYSLLISF